MRPYITATGLTAVLVPLFWSLVFPLSKVVLQDLPPLSLVALRYSVGSAFLAAVALVTGNRSEMARLLREKWPSMFTLGFIAVASNASQIVGLRYASTAEGAIIASTSPVYAAMLGAIFLNEKVRSNQIAGLLMSLAGVSGIALAENRHPGNGSAIGSTLMFLGAVTYAAYTVLGKKWGASSSPVLAVSTGLGVIPFLLLAGFTEPLASSLVTARLTSWLNLIALGILPTGVAVIWFFGLVSELGAARASVITYLVPVFGLVQSSILLGERMSPALILGGAASLAGVALTQYQGRERRSEEVRNTSAR